MPILNTLVLFLCLIVSTFQFAFAEPISLKQARNIALLDNPVLAEIASRHEAALQVPAQVSALPDPTVTLGLLSIPTDSFDLNQEAMTQFQIGFSQALPWTSERRLAKSAAVHQANAISAEFEEAKNILIRDVTKSWWTLFYINQSLAVIEENLQRLREFNHIALSRYRVGQGLQQDTLLAQLQLSTQLEQKLVLGTQLRNTEAQLNALMARAGSSPIELPTNPDIALNEFPTTEKLIEIAMQKRPWLLQKRLNVSSASVKKELAQKGLLPDLSIGAAYGYRQDAPNGSERSNLVSVSLNVKIPLYAKDKQHREIRQRDNELYAKNEALKNVQFQIRREVIQSVSNYQQALEQAEILDKGMLPQSKQTVASMLAGYQVGEVDFSALVQAQLMVNRLQLKYWKAISDGQKARAEIYSAVGIPELFNDL